MCIKPINPHVLGPSLKMLPAAIIISAQLLLAEKSSAMVAVALVTEKTAAFTPPALTRAPMQTFIPSLGWRHYGIND
jgi:hypothetical protein